MCRNGETAGQAPEHSTPLINSSTARCASNLSELMFENKHATRGGKKCEFISAAFRQRATRICAGLPYINLHPFHHWHQGCVIGSHATDQRTVPLQRVTASAGWRITIYLIGVDLSRLVSQWLVFSVITTGRKILRSSQKEKVMTKQKRFDRRKKRSPRILARAQEISNC